MKVLRGESGQAQLLLAVIAGIVAILGGAYSLDISRRSIETQSDQSRLSESRSALDEALKFAANVYQSYVGCDPSLLNTRLNYLKPDGTFGSVLTRRRLDVTINADADLITKSYTISFGRVEYLSSLGGVFSGSASIFSVLPSYSTPGVFKSQDAIIEAWITDSNRTRVSQRAVLMNICTTPCSQFQRKTTSTTTGSGFCANQPARDVAGLHDVFSYHSLNLSLYPASEPIAGNVCTGGNKFGTTCIGACSASSAANDILQLREFLRGGTGGPLFAYAANFIGDGITQGCMDLNGDRSVNSIDLNILEKFQRGYIQRIPTNL